MVYACLMTSLSSRRRKETGYGLGAEDEETEKKDTLGPGRCGTSEDLTRESARPHRLAGSPVPLLNDPTT